MRLFFAYLLNLALFSSTLLILRENGFTNTYGLKLQRIYPVFEILFISLYFYNLLKSKYKGWIIFTGAGLLFVVFFISFLAFSQKLPFLPLVLQEIFLLIIIMFSFYEKIKNVSEIPVYLISNFWISLGFLIYFSGTFFLYLVSIPVAASSVEYWKQYSFVITCFVVIKNILFLIAIYINRQNELNNKKTAIPKFDFDDYKNPLPKPVIYNNK